ncbi:MAG: hypothetical protein OHK003_22480 [Anaerolineales bacterium]
MTQRQTFSKGFLTGISVFILLNLFAAHLFSDCGLPALFGLGACADAITRAGFPFVFFTQGGFAYHSDFNMPFFILDIFLGIGFAILMGFLFSKSKKRR